MEPPLPDRSQARRLVASLAVFWGGFGLSMLGLRFARPFGAAVFAISFGGAIFFYLTLYSVWEHESGVPAWRMMLVPGFSPARRRAARNIILDLVRPAWIKHTLRETGWPMRLVGAGLLVLLAFAMAAFVVIAPQAGSS